VALKELLLATLLVLSIAEARPAARCPGAAASPQLIEIAGYSFDPLADAAPVPAHLRTEPAATGSSWWLVQLHRSPTRAERARLQRQFALELTRHVPVHAYLEKIDAARVGELRREDLVRAVIAHQPAFKISPALRAPAEGRLVVTLFDAADAEGVMGRLRTLGAQELIARGDRIRFALADRMRLADISRIEAVRWIEAPPSRNEDAPR
jgi:hypothetical protein